MNIERRVYKFSETKQEIHYRITRLDENSNLHGRWMDESNFIIKNRGSFTLLTLQGNIDETEEKGKLKVQITAGYKFFLLYLLPVVFTLFGIWKISKNTERGILIIFTGISLLIFIFAYTSAITYRLKKRFKESFNLM
jgi:hypothetical protein